MENPYLVDNSIRLKMVLSCPKEAVWNLIGTCEGYVTWFPTSCTGTFEKGKTIQCGWWGSEPGEEHTDELISNVNFVPCVKDKWVIVRHENGWCIVGGTLEPGEGYLDTIKRELMEEAGAVLKTFHLVGAWHCHSLADKPYRPHLPWPEFYRLLAYGEVETSGKPTNPKGAEQVSEVAALSLEEACRRLETKEDDGKQLADSYRLVDALKAQRLAY